MAENKAQREELPLEISGQLYRHLFESLNDAAFIADVETGRILQTNYRGVQLLGRSRDEIIGMHQSEFHPPAEAERYREKFAQHVREGRAAINDGEILEVLRKDGARVPVTISASTLEIGGRRLLIGLFRDMRELKRAEEALRRSEELFKTLAESAPMGIFLTDVEGNTDYANGKVREIFGFSEGDISSDRWQKSVHPDDIRRVIGNQEKAARDGRPLEQEFRIIRPDGEMRWVHTRTVILPAHFRRDRPGEPAAHVGTCSDICAPGCLSRPVSHSMQGVPACAPKPATAGEGRGGILGIVEDVTDKKRAEEERLRSAKVAAVLELAGAACHELNQPLQVVSGFAQLIRDHLERESPLRGDVMKMLEGVEKLAAITRKLNSITRYETKDYLKGWKIVDLDKAASGGEPPGGADED